jgi:hypothetical protein
MGKEVKCQWCGHEKCPKCHDDKWPSLRDGCCHCAFLVGSILGLDNLSDCRGYIQGWLQGDSIPEKSAQKIFKVADQILKAGSESAERMD